MKVMYYIAVLPPQVLREEIRTFKTEILRKFGSGHALRSPAHITLQMPFHFEEDEESRLVNALRDLAQHQEAFDCTLEDFGHFGNRTVFIEVHPNEDLSDLRKSLQNLLRDRFNFNAKKLPQRFHPHITIANRDLEADRFDACLDTFRSRSYRRTFEIDAFALLKHRGDHWEVYREFPFREG